MYQNQADLREEEEGFRPVRGEDRLACSAMQYSQCVCFSRWHAQYARLLSYRFGGPDKVFLAVVDATKSQEGRFPGCASQLFGAVSPKRLG